jgi:fumarate reductase subunit C
MKWGPLTSENSTVVRARLKVAMWSCVAFFLCLGTASLLTYMKIGYEHADQAGQPYIPGALK